MINAVARFEGEVWELSVGGGAWCGGTGSARLEGCRRGAGRGGGAWKSEAECSVQCLQVYQVIVRTKWSGAKEDAEKSEPAGFDKILESMSYISILLISLQLR